MILLENIYCSENEYTKAFECIRTVESFLDESFPQTDNFHITLYKYLRGSCTEVARA